MVGNSDISREDYTPAKIKFVGELQTMINTWIEGNPTRSMASLAQSAKVSNASLQRLLNNDRKIANELIFNIVSYIYDQDTFGGIAQALEKDNKLLVLEWFTKYHSYMSKHPVLQEHKRIPASNAVATNPMVFFCL